MSETATIATRPRAGDKVAQYIAVPDRTSVRPGLVGMHCSIWDVNGRQFNIEITEAKMLAIDLETMDDSFIHDPNTLVVKGRLIESIECHVPLLKIYTEYVDFPPKQV